MGNRILRAIRKLSSIFRFRNSEERFLDEMAVGAFFILKRYNRVYFLDEGDKISLSDACENSAYGMISYINQQLTYDIFDRAKPFSQKSEILISVYAKIATKLGIIR